MHKLFLNQILFEISDFLFILKIADYLFYQVFSVIIRGPSSLDHKPGSKSSNATMDTIWGLTEVTPSAIAASAIFVSS